jgi:hypothetical protein
MKKLLVILLMIPGFARAEFDTGNTLYQRMTSSNNMDKMYALGYIGGVYDAYQHIFHCPPATNSITLGQVNDIVRNHLEANPAQRHRTADQLVKEALQRVWPCSNNRGGTRL